MDEELIRYIRTRTQPDSLDIEIAKQIILDNLNTISQTNFAPISSSQLIAAVTINRQSFEKPVSIERGDEAQLEDHLIGSRVELIAREALLSLHANGVLIAYGNVFTSTIPGGIIEREVKIINPLRTEILGTIFFPGVHHSYGLAAPFREDHTFRLANGDIYLSSLNQAQLPSRAKRCLKECVNAFRYGLYLSATMSVGAASESLWMKLGLLLRDKKPSLTNQLEQIKLLYPSISVVIKETWQVLTSHFDSELKQIFLNKGERIVFKDHADRLCERRNYAMHSEDANEEEPYFTHNETGILLLASINYFNRLTKIIATIEALP